MRVLVIGSKGTLGTPLVEELTKRGHEVWQCDLQHQRDDNYIRADVASTGSWSGSSKPPSTTTSTTWPRSSGGSTARSTSTRCGRPT